MSALWEAREFVAALAGRPVGELHTDIDGISIDSRTITNGEAFFAIKGDRVDGHDYASRAAANGAAVLVVSEDKLPALGRMTVPLIVVDDVLEALVRLGRASRARAKAKIIAVTGSAGKTTSKEMLRKVLTPSGSVHASVASFNNHWGVPLTLARMPRDCDFAVFEIGMNHPGEIRELVDMVRPEIAIVTTVVGAHLGHFSGVAEIAEAKAEITEGIVPGGHVILNRDNEYFSILEDAAKRNGVSHIHTFGENAEAQFRLAEFNGQSEYSEVKAVIAGRALECVIGAPGRHIAQNALAVLGAAFLAGADMERACEALEGFAAEKGRGQRHKLSLGGDKGSFTLIDESYNANPGSMRAAIELLTATVPTGDGRRIAVLGDMREMGEASLEAHSGLAEPLLDAGVDEVWLAGEEMAALKEALGSRINVTYTTTADELTPFVLENIRAGDAVMIKSSLGTGFVRITAAILDKFSPAA